MPENRGYYQKYQVARTDGRPITGPTFTMEINRDPHALPALKAYRESAAAAGDVPLFVADLDRMIIALEGTGSPALES